jgi:hypothetical protein
MKSLIAAAAALLALAGTASAADAKGGYAVLGTGAFTCGDLLSGGEDAGQVFSIWMHGYATALNQAIPDVKDVTGGRTDGQLLDALYGYCNGKNEEVLADAARNVIIGMSGIKPAGKKAKKKPEAKPELTEEALPELRR